MRIYQTWLKKHLVSFLSPQKGHILISQRVLQTQISTGTELGDHSRNLACPESSCLDLSILRASLWFAGCRSHRQGVVGLLGQAGSRADVTAELSSRQDTVPKNPTRIVQITFLHNSRLRAFIASIADRPFPQYKRATPANTQGRSMRNLNIAFS